MIGDESERIAAEARRRPAAPGSTWPGASSGSRMWRSTTAGISPRRSRRSCRPRWRSSGRAGSSPATRARTSRSTARSTPIAAASTAASTAIARPSHSFLGLSPGLDFETRLTAKPDAAKVLAAELSAAGYRPEPIAIGTNTDPYQPLEKRIGIMREVLGGAARLRPSGHGADQGRADRARRRHPRRDGPGRARGGRAVGDDARPQARPGDGAAGGGAGAAAARRSAGSPRPAARRGSRSGR